MLTLLISQGEEVTDGDVVAGVGSFGRKDWRRRQLRSLPNYQDLPPIVLIR